MRYTGASSIETARTSSARGQIIRHVAQMRASSSPTRTALQEKPSTDERNASADIQQSTVRYMSTVSSVCSTKHAASLRAWLSLGVEMKGRGAWSVQVTDRLQAERCVAIFGRPRGRGGCFVLLGAAWCCVLLHFTLLNFKAWPCAFTGYYMRRGISHIRKLLETTVARAHDNRKRG